MGASLSSGLFWTYYQSYYDYWSSINIMPGEEELSLIHIYDELKPLSREEIEEMNEMEMAIPRRPEDAERIIAFAKKAI